MSTYRTGYPPYERRRTLEELKAWPPFAMLHPEIQRRAIALMDHSHANGRDLGIGGAGRTSAQQLAVFLERHNQVPAGGCCGYNGKRYALKAGAAHAAPPGRSFHEETVDGRWAVAIDWVGWEDGWMETQLADFGLVSAKDWSVKEPWHTQPVEFPRARKDYDPATHQLTVWPLDDKDDDMPTPVNKRTLDTRIDGTPLVPEVTYEFPVAFGGSSALLSFTALPVGDGAGHVVAWPAGSVKPDTAAVAWVEGRQTTGTYLVGLRESRINVTVSAPCHLVIDTQAVWG